MKKDKRMEGEDKVRWKMERQESGTEDEGEGKDQWRRGRMGRKERSRIENKGWYDGGGGSKMADRYCPYVIIKCVIINLPELIHVVVQLCFLQYTLHHGDENSLVSERWERWGEGGGWRRWEEKVGRREEEEEGGKREEET